MDQQMELAKQAEIARLTIEKEEMRKLATRAGFFMFYYECLPKAVSNVSAFNETNELYYKHFGEYRYSDYDSFKKMTNYYSKKK